MRLMARRPLKPSIKFAPLIINKKQSNIKVDEKKLLFRNFDKKGMSIFEILIGIKCIEINKTNIIKTSLFDGLILVLKSSKKPIKNIKLHMNKYSNKIFE
jgi:hypothetical protein